jgi:hypothetical protein
MMRRIERMQARGARRAIMAAAAFAAALAILTSCSHGSRPGLGSISLKPALSGLSRAGLGPVVADSQTILPSDMDLSELVYAVQVSNPSATPSIVYGVEETDGSFSFDSLPAGTWVAHATASLASVLVAEGDGNVELAPGGAVTAGLDLAPAMGGTGSLGLELTWTISAELRAELTPLNPSGASIDLALLGTRGPTSFSYAGSASPGIYRLGLMLRDQDAQTWWGTSRIVYICDGAATSARIAVPAGAYKDRTPIAPSTVQARWLYESYMDPTLLMSVQWFGCLGAETFDVYRRESADGWDWPGGFYSLLSGLWPEAWGFVDCHADFPLSPGTYYQYEIVATNAAGTTSFRTPVVYVDPSTPWIGDGDYGILVPYDRTEILIPSRDPFISPTDTITVSLGGDSYDFYVDGQYVTSKGDFSSITVAELGLKPGMHTITALETVNGLAYSSEPLHIAYSPQPLELKWTRDLSSYGTDFWGMAGALSPDGRTLYMHGSDGRVYAMNASTGALDWISANVDGPVSYHQGASVGPDGTIYVGVDGRMSALDPATGALRWTTLSSGYNSAPAIGDGIIYSGGYGDLVAYSAAAGGILFTKAIEPGAELSMPAIGASGNVFVGTETSIYGIGQFGTSILWSSGLESHSSPAIDEAGNIVTGMTPKRYDNGGTPLSTPAETWGPSFGYGSVIGPDGSIYATDENFNLVCYNPNGSLKWGRCDTLNGDYLVNPGAGLPGVTYALESQGWGFPAVAQDGTVYVCSGEIWVHAYDGQDGTRLATFEDFEGYPSTAPIIGNDGVVFVGNDFGIVYAFWGTGSPLASSPWPMAGRDPQHSGNARKD